MIKIYSFIFDFSRIYVLINSIHFIYFIYKLTNEQMGLLESIMNPLKNLELKINNFHNYRYHFKFL